jgi:hypothetical protein
MEDNGDAHFTVRIYSDWDRIGTTARDRAAVNRENEPDDEQVWRSVAIYRVS